MQLKSLSLKNIRSYPSLDLEFRKGSTLLSGDIGSGKTTILLSIEFALFGLMKGMLSGGALLRHGEREGSVRLSFLLEDPGQEGGREITIMRALKRSGSPGTGGSITQDAGFLEMNGERKDLTPVEMKSAILALLGYPDELLTKSKSLIFRYTVYTPQEEMKQIILDGEEERLEKLVKIFNVEKYKRIRENAETYARELRAEAKVLPSLEKELDDLKETHRRHESGMEEKNISLLNLRQRLLAEQKTVSENEAKMKEFDESLKRHNALKQELSLVLVEQKNTKRNIEAARHELNILDAQMKKLTEELVKEREELSGAAFREQAAISDELTNYKDRKEEIDKIRFEDNSRLGAIQSKKEESLKLKTSIMGLEKCPTCQQNVGEKHKHGIEEEEDRKLRELEEKETRFREHLEKAEKNLRIITKKIESLNIELLSASEHGQKQKHLAQREQLAVENGKKAAEKNEKIREFEKELLTWTMTEQELREKLDAALIDDKLVEEVSNRLRESRDAYLALRVKEAGLLQSIKENASSLEENERAQQAKKEQITAVERRKKTEHWLSNHFLNLVDVIEKHVLASIHAEFKSHFEEWFNMLIEEESITATLDERFTPRVSQNGYDTEIENLSGGEKTSVALAYRLALNKVINGMLSTIKTRNLIILDEPTDGFSSHQLDKVREVLGALHSGQTIIVSHESKMESFVDHIIRLRKHESESGVYG